MLRVLTPAVVAAFVLSGCGLAENAVEGAVEQAVERGVEEATGADLETTDDGFTMKTEDGEFTMGSDGSLPDGFPENEVPLVDGDIIQTAKVADGTQDAFHVTVDSPGDFDTVGDKAMELLEGAGYTVAGEVNVEGMRSASLEGSGNVAAVTVGVMEGYEEGQTSVSYTVVMAE